MDLVYVQWRALGSLQGDKVGSAWLTRVPNAGETLEITETRLAFNPRFPYDEPSKRFTVISVAHVAQATPEAFGGYATIPNTPSVYSTPPSIAARLVVVAA